MKFKVGLCATTNNYGTISRSPLSIASLTWQSKNTPHANLTNLNRKPMKSMTILYNSTTCPCNSNMIVNPHLLHMVSGTSLCALWHLGSLQYGYGIVWISV